MSTDKLKVLVGFEFSGRIREAFAKLNWDAWSIDKQETEIESNKHIVGDIYELIPWIISYKFDIGIFHPPCTYTAVSGNAYHANSEKRIEAIKDFIFWDQFEHIPRRVIEHPVSIISSQYRKPDQYIEPWQFGHGETKKTGLWLTGLQKLQPTNIVDGRVPRVWLEGPGEERKNNRSRTYRGIAEAIAAQYSNPDNWLLIQNRLEAFFS